MSYLRTIVGQILAVVLMLGAGYYIGQKVFLSVGRIPTRSWVLIVIVLTILALGVLTFTTTSRTKAATIAYWVSGFIVSILLYFLLTLIVVDLLSLVLHRSAGVRIMIAIGGATVVTIYGVRHAFDTKITHQTIMIPGLKDRIKALHLTDTHFGHARGHAEATKIISRIQQINPDIVLFTGDMFDSPVALDDHIFELFGKLSMPIYYIEGNHDVHVGVSEIKQSMRDQGVHVLENEIAHYRELAIIGLNHMAADDDTANVHVRDTSHTVKSVLDEMEIDPSLPTILLHHSPDGLEHAASHGVNLFLAGHTHGGQLFPITIFAKYLFTQNYGRYLVDGMETYISSGTGTFGPVVRVATRSEIAILTLEPA